MCECVREGGGVIAGRAELQIILEIASCSICNQDQTSSSGGGLGMWGVGGMPRIIRVYSAAAALVHLFNGAGNYTSTLQ